ncbi:mRNA turnover 4 [Geranomyces variabilis]|nr:ribosomal protein L10-domain-containing protein [Geranomyces variabilis]KAJ3140322.1 mRNA turnover 4 [Geranomyces variabilis]KAJ3153543.1 mRNA turnover 4 [Geranomyces variabilis]
MPKSKRVKIVNLTQTDKKTSEHKAALVAAIHEALTKYAHAYVFSVENMRNTFLKDVRHARSADRFFFGRNRVMAKALGGSAQDEAAPEAHQLAARLVGNVGLIFSDDGYDEMKAFFDAFVKRDYARSGAVAVETVELPAGPLMRGVDPVPHNMEPQLRGLGLPTVLVNGVVTLKTDHVVCTKGQTLTPDQANILKHFYIQQADFHVTLLCHLSKGVFTDHAQEEDAMATDA